MRRDYPRLPLITPDYPWPRAAITSNLDRAARVARDVTCCVGSVFGGWPFTRRWLSMTQGGWLYLLVLNFLSATLDFVRLDSEKMGYV